MQNTGSRQTWLLNCPSKNCDPLQ